MKIEYTTTTFNRPIVGRQDYEELKNILSKDPHSEIEPKSETITERFSDSIKLLKICGICLIIGMIGTEMYGDGIFVFVLGISSLGLLFSLIMFLFQAPSYATFINKKKAFFDELKTAVINTNSFDQFDLVFNRKQ